ncbi:MAG: hypothetical protein IGS03_17825 [Candidatus Sericytochromatia bacterium]|nr:hypothetical protein [Candidatus Sericytochromatia bacterium]
MTAINPSQNHFSINKMEKATGKPEQSEQPTPNSKPVPAVPHNPKDHLDQHANCKHPGAKNEMPFVDAELYPCSAKLPEGKLPGMGAEIYPCSAKLPEGKPGMGAEIYPCSAKIPEGKPGMGAEIYPCSAKLPEGSSLADIIKKKLD